MVELLLTLLTTLTGIERTVDSDLTALAQQRAVQIQTDFSHNGQPPQTYEIIAWNSYPDPIQHLAAQWQDSPTHWAILTNPNLRVWGCGVSQSGGVTWGVCLFRAGTASIAPSDRPPPAPTSTPAPVVLQLPDAAMENQMVTDLNIRTVGMYALGLLILAACFWLIQTTPGEHVQEWATITGIIGFLIRDAGGAAGTRAAERITAANADAQPTMTTTSGTPPSQTITTVSGGDAEPPERVIG